MRREALRALHITLPLHQVFPDHVQRHGGGESADPLAVTGEIALDHFGSAVAGYGVEDEAHWLVRSAARRSGYTRDADSDARLAAVADAFGERRRHFVAHRSMAVDHLGGNAGEFGLQLIGINDRAAEKIAGTAANGSDALRNQPAGAGFSDGNRCIAHLQPVADDLFERFAVARIHGIIEFVFDESSYF